MERLSQLEERQRISRDLHDTLSHHLTGILMQVDAARQDPTHDRDRGLEILDAAYKNINSSIEEVGKDCPRASTGSHGGRSGIHQARLRNVSRIQVYMFSTGPQVPPIALSSVEITLYKNIQGGIDQCPPPWKAKNVDIHLHYGEAAIELSIVDDGGGAKTIRKGFGLKGMEERLELVGGSMTYSGDGGFQIQMTIPRREL